MSLNNELLNAIKNGDIKKVKLILDLSANIYVDAKDKDGNTPLILAAYNNYIEIAEFLIEKGADVNVVGIFDLTALHMAIHKDNTKMVEFLIKKGADINAINEHGVRPLIQAINNNHLEIAKLLIVNGAGVDTTNPYGKSAICIAAYNGNMKMVKLLVKMGAIINVKNNDGNTTLHLAAYKGHIEVATFLIEKGADVNAINKCSYKAIHLAAQKGHQEIVEFLMKVKADAQGDKLFSVVKCDNVDNFAQEYNKLFKRDSKNILNHIIPYCISQIPFLDKTFKGNTKYSDSDDISKGLCQSFVTLVTFLNLNSKKDFDELYNLMDFNSEELNEENFQKFLENKLENNKVRAVFELVQAIVEYSPILNFLNMKSDELLPQKTLINYVSDNCYDMRSHKIVINKSKVSSTLKELKNGDDILFMVANISKDGSGHAISIKKTYTGQYIFFDSNMLHVLELQSEEVCDVMERAINKYYSIFYGGFGSSFIQTSLIHLTETVKELIKHYEHEYESNLDSHIWDIKLEAFRQGIITEYKGNNTSF